MKLLPYILISLLIVGCSSAPPKLNVAPVRTSVTNAQGSVTKAQSHAKTAKEKIIEIEKTSKEPETLKLALGAKTEIDSLTQNLLDAQLSLQVAQNKIKELEAQAKVINKKLEDADRVRKKYERLKFPICTVAAAGVAALLFKFKSILAFMGPYALIALIGGPVAVFGALWAVL